MRGIQIGIVSDQSPSALTTIAGRKRSPSLLNAMKKPSREGIRLFVMVSLPCSKRHESPAPSAEPAYSGIEAICSTTQIAPAATNTHA